MLFEGGSGSKMVSWKQAKMMSAELARDQRDIHSPLVN
jgi:hypothetical protein